MTMIDVRPGLRAYLLADPAIAAIVVDRCYPVILPQGEDRASIVYTRISAQGDYHMRGPSGLARPRIQIDSWAASVGEVSALSLAVKLRLEGFRGVMPWNGGSSSANVQGLFFESEFDDYDAASHHHRVSQDYFVWFEERA